MKQEVPVWLGVLFPVAFLCMWIVVSFILSRFGWARLAERFQSDRPIPSGARRFLWQSMSVGSKFGSPGYNNCINVWIDEQALYLRPSLPFRAFHPLLRIHWRDVVSVAPRKVMIFKTVELIPRHGAPSLVFSGRSGRAITERWQSTGGGS